MISYKDIYWGESTVGPHVSGSSICAVRYFSVMKSKWVPATKLLLLPIVPSYNIYYGSVMLGT